MKDFCGIRTGANNASRRSELMGQYGRAALSVAPTPQTFSYRKRIRKGKLPPSAFGCHPPQRGRLCPTHNLTFSAARHREGFAELFLKKRVFCQAFLHKKADLLTKNNHIQNRFNSTKSVKTVYQSDMTQQIPQQENLQ